MKRSPSRQLWFLFCTLFMLFLTIPVGAQNVTSLTQAPESTGEPNAGAPADGEQGKVDTRSPQGYKVPGAAGKSSVKPQSNPPEGSPTPVEDRWRIGYPEWNRTVRGHILNPYRQNVLKGDYPIIGQNTFLVMTGESVTATIGRRVPVPSDVSSARPNSEEFFGRGEMFIMQQNFILSTTLFHGETAYRPVDWQIKFTPVFNVNYVIARENGIINRDVRRGTTRLDGRKISLQDAFVEVRLGDTTKVFPFLRGKDSRGGHSPFFDSTALRVGIQQFNSDFRGLIFLDNNLGARLFGNYNNNKWQYNLAYFNMLEKDTNSGLNTFDWRHQRVYIANLYRQDFIKPGYTAQISLHYNDDQPSIKIDNNRFIVRPAQVGIVAPHSVKAGYIGWTGDGHFRRFNINHAFYQAFGRDSLNPISQKGEHINAQLAALELSMDRDWQRFRTSVFFTSGDGNLRDGKAGGFDSILDKQFFAGGDNSFWNSQEIRLTQTGVAITTQDSLIPSLRSSKTQGQANFVNPGILVINGAYDADLTPKLRLNVNFNYLRFHRTAVLQDLLFQPRIRHNIGFDYGAGVIFRPLLSENVILRSGFSIFSPLSGFTDIYTSNCKGVNCGQGRQTLFALYSKLIFTF